MTATHPTGTEAGIRAFIAADPHDFERRNALADYLDETDRHEEGRDERLTVRQWRVCCSPDDDAARLEWASIAESVPVDEGALEEVRRELSEWWDTSDGTQRVRAVNWHRCCISYGGGREEWCDKGINNITCDYHGLSTREAQLARTLSLHRRAEFVLTQVAIANHPAHRLNPDATYGEYAELRKRERELFDKFVLQWFDERVSIYYLSDEEADESQLDTLTHAVIRRGFIDRIRCQFSEWLAHGQRIACWRLGWTMECGRCDGDGWLHAEGSRRRVACPYCHGTRRTARPFGGSEQPVRRLVLTTRPSAMELIRYGYATDGEKQSFAEWPGLEVELPR